MPEIIEERDSHLLVLNDEGDTEFIPMSPFNRLLYKHGLFGLLKDQDELWTAADGDEKEWVLIEPLGDHEYHVETHEIETTIKRHEKTELVDYLVEAYKQGDDESPDPQPVISGIMRMRDFDAIPSHVDPLAETPTFADHVDVQSDGWLINDHVLLTYDNQFKHEHIDTHERSGDDVRPVENDQDAYELRFSYQDDLSERSGQSADDVEFIARAKWAIDHTAE